MALPNLTVLLFQIHVNVLHLRILSRERSCLLCSLPRTIRARATSKLTILGTLSLTPMGNPGLSVQNVIATDRLSHSKGELSGYGLKYKPHEQDFDHTPRSKAINK